MSTAATFPDAGYWPTPDRKTTGLALPKSLLMATAALLLAGNVMFACTTSRDTIISNTDSPASDATDTTSSWSDSDSGSSSSE